MEFISVDARQSHKVDQTSAVELKQGDTALVRLVPLRPICLETQHDFPHLSRVVFRDQNGTVAVGVVKASGTSA